MIGPGTVITECLGRITPHENGAGMTNLPGHRFRISDRQLQVLGRDVIGNLDRLIEIIDVDQGTTVTKWIFR